jgi:hypothetical protein
MSSPSGAAASPSLYPHACYRVGVVSNPQQGSQDDHPGIPFALWPAAYLQAAPGHFDETQKKLGVAR